MSYHPGELEMQARAGVQIMAQRVRRGIHDTMPPVAQDFLLDQTFAATASVAADGSVWASLLTGEPGFLHPQDAQTLRIAAQAIPGDPLEESLRHHPDLGLVVIDLATRQRVRLNGMAKPARGGWLLSIREAYSNCQKYIQARAPLPVERLASEAKRGSVLTPAQQAQIAKADTFFIASYHPESGADASHRGGTRGFARVYDASRLEFPDYAGNMMFNTLGNITANPRAGLLFIDFEQGGILQISGRAEVVWDADRIAAIPGAQRLVTFSVEQVIEKPNAIPLQFSFLQASPFNPPVPEIS